MKDTRDRKDTKDGDAVPGVLGVPGVLLPSPGEGPPRKDPGRPSWDGRPGKGTSTREGFG